MVIPRGHDQTADIRLATAIRGCETVNRHPAQGVCATHNGGIDQPASISLRPLIIALALEEQAVKGYRPGRRAPASG